MEVKEAEELDLDPVGNVETVGYYSPEGDKSFMRAAGQIPPGTDLNPTRDVESFVEIIDKGEAVVFINDPELKQIKFKGGCLDGLWLFSKKNGNWRVERTGAGSVIKGG